MKQNQFNLNFYIERNKNTKKGRAEFHKLGQLLKAQKDEENRRAIKYTH